MGAREEAGKRNEQDVAFHLKRRFESNPEVKVFNDIKIRHGKEAAQIDHLVLHRCGFLIIESKSIYGEVRVNSNGEWSRSYKGQWFGMPSPIVQAENQTTILKAALHERENGEDLDLLDPSKIRKQQFTRRTYHQIAAVSSSAIIHRDGLAKEIGDQVVKAEFIPEAVERIIGQYSGVWGALMKAQPSFSNEEMKRIGAFLSEFIQQAQSQAQESKNQKPAAMNESPANSKTPQKSSSRKKPSSEGAAKTPPQTQSSAEVSQKKQPEASKSPGSQSAPDTWEIACKHCGNRAGLQSRYGKYGYYVACPKCEKNTRMQQSCPQCANAKTKVSKKKSTFTLSCQSCGHVALFTDQTQQ